MKARISHIGRYIWDRKQFIVPFIVFAVFLLMMAPHAYAADNSNSGGEYMNIDPKAIFSDGKGGNNLWGGATDILSVVITGILLPAGILMSAWRVIYIAVFPMIMHLDPLDMLRSDRYTKKRKMTGALGSQHIAESFFGGTFNNGSFKAGDGGASGHTNYGGSTLTNDYFSGTYADGGKVDQKAAKKAITHEIKNMFIGLLITFSVWIFLQLIMRLAVLLLGFAETVSI